MRTRSHLDEAKYCRDLASEFVGRPERPFLLKAAEVFDDLAGRNPQEPPGVIGPLGELLTQERLPATVSTRWTPRRKAEVVVAVAGGLLTFEEACDRYSLSMEELTGWQRAVESSGMRGLRVTRIQEYRDSQERRRP